jgi:copper chaperone
MEQTTINVKGMTCDACQSAVTNALNELDGVTSVEINLKEGKAGVSYDPSKITFDQMKKAVEEQGYDVA